MRFFYEKLMKTYVTEAGGLQTQSVFIRITIKESSITENIYIYTPIQKSFIYTIIL